jgi:thiosulfate dehydrogenase (quinone) large subunit
LQIEEIAHMSVGDALQRVGTLPLRFFLGLTFIYAALVKLADPGYLDPSAGGAYLGNQLLGFVDSSPIGFLIEAVALPQIQLVGVAVVVTELVVGVLVVAGVFTRLAAAVGAMLSLQLFLTLTWNIQPYFLAPDSMYAVAWVTLALVGDGGRLSLQSLVQARSYALRSRLHPALSVLRSL